MTNKEFVGRPSTPPDTLAGLIQPMFDSMARREADSDRPALASRVGG